MGVSLFYLREKCLSANVYKLFVSLGMNTNDFTKALQDSKSEGKKGGEDIASSMMNSLKNNVVKLASSLAIGATLKKSITDAMDFTDSMAKMSTLFDTTKYSVSDLSKEFVGLSNETGKSATELAEAGYQALSASVPMEKLTDFTRTATNLAKVGFTDAATSVDILTTAMNAYGEKAGTAEQIANKLVLTQNLGKTTVAELASNMGRTIPTANAMGVSIDNLTASYAFMTKQGVNTQIATTQLNAMFNELGDSGTTVAKIIKEKTGQSFKEFMEDGHTLSDALKVLQEYSNDTGTAFNELWASAEAGKAGLSLTNEEAGNFNEIVKEMGENTSVLGEGLEKLATPQAKLNKAMNVGRNMMISFGESILGTAAPALDSFTNIMNTVADTMSNSSNIFQALQILGNNMFDWFTGDGLAQLIQCGTQMIVGLSQGLIEGIPNLLEQALPMILQFAESLRANFGTIVDAGIEFLQNLVQGIANGLPQLIAYVPQIIIEFCGLINDNLPKLLVAGVQMLITLGQGIINAIPDLLANIPKIFEAVIAVWSALNWIDLGKNLIKWVTDGIKNLSSQIPNAVKTIGQNAKNFFSNIDWSGAGHNAIKLIAAAARSIGNLVWTAVGNIGKSAFNSFKNINWADLGSNLVRGIWNGISNMTGWIINLIGGFTNKVLKSIKGFFGIHSPSKKTAWVGKMLMFGMSKGIDDNASEVISSMADMGKEVMKEADSMSIKASVKAIGESVTVSNKSDGSSKYKTSGGIVINVYASEGMDIDELVEELMIKLEKARKKEEEVFA